MPDDRTALSAQARTRQRREGSAITLPLFMGTGLYSASSDPLAGFGLEKAQYMCIACFAPLAGKSAVCQIYGCKTKRQGEHSDSA